jgi:hypothetical protein
MTVGVSASSSLSVVSRCRFHENPYLEVLVTSVLGRPIAQAVSRWLPGFEPGSGKCDLWWTKWRWGRFSPSTSVSPANLYSTKFLHHHNHPGQVQ